MSSASNDSDGDGDATHCLYVVDLNPAVWDERKKMRRANPHYDRDKARGRLYVGMTSKTPEERFAEHKAGGFLAAPVVTRYGRYLRPRLQENFSRLSEAEAVEAEKRRAIVLRNRGFAVWPISEQPRPRRRST